MTHRRRLTALLLALGSALAGFSGTGAFAAQSGGGPSSLVFTSQHGTVPLDALKVVEVLRSES